METLIKGEKNSETQSKHKNIVNNHPATLLWATFADTSALVWFSTNECIYLHINNISFIWLLQLPNYYLNNYANLKLWLTVYIGFETISATKDWSTPGFLPNKWVIQCMYIINILCFSAGEAVNTTDLTAWRAALWAVCNHKISQ